MVQCNELDPSYVYKAADAGKTEQNLEYASISDLTSQQPAHLTKLNPPKKQRNSRAKKKNDDPQPQSLCSAALPERNQNSAHQQGLSYPNNRPQMQARFQRPPQFPPQISNHSASMPFNTFNRYVAPFPPGKYGTSSTTEIPYNPFAHRAMQNMWPTTFQLNQSLTSPITIFRTHPYSPFPFTEADFQLFRQRNSHSCPMHSGPSTAVSTLSNLADSTKRCNGLSGETSAFHCYKRPRTLSPTGYETTPSTSPSNSSDESSLSIAPITLGDENHQINGKNALHQSNYVDLTHDFDCVLCHETRKDTVLLPCKHLCVCEKCSGGVMLCPLCGVECRETLNVYT